EIYLGRGDRVGLVEWRRGRTGQVVDLAEFAPERLRHVVVDHLEPAVAQQVFDVPPPSGVVVVDADDVTAHRDQPVTQVRAQKAGGAGDENAIVAHFSLLTQPLGRHRGPAIR